MVYSLYKPIFPFEMNRNIINLLQPLKNHPRIILYGLKNKKCCYVKENNNYENIIKVNANEIN